MRRAKVFATMIYAALVMSTMTFVHFPDLVAREMHPKIGADQARATALRAVPGTVKGDELETEHGRLVYSFEIARPEQRGVTEVSVSAMDGSIVKVHREHARKSRGAQRYAELNAESAAHRDVL